MSEGELEAEQAWLDHAQRCLDGMADRTTAAREASDRAVRDENTADARVAQWHLKKRERDLAAGAGPLCFGRIDEEPFRGQAGPRWYVGRRHIEDRDGAAVIVDWRAPVSAPFYRATAVDPCGLVHRRRFSIEDGVVTALFDEDLTDPESAGAAGLPDPLLAELDRSRTGQMRDIVATIAAEQDLIIRAELDELLIVQGGPGTGKTAVGLHRAAYLLFQHRMYLADHNVLVVGPNRLFLRYIADVLPSLGESSVVQTTAEGLLAAKFTVRAEDSPSVTEVKGRLDMATVIANAVAAKISVPDDGVELVSGVVVIRLTAGEVGQIQKTALARQLPSNDGREVFRQMLVQEAWRRHSDRVGVDTGTQPSFTAALKNDPGFKKLLDKMWPTLSAPVVVRELYGSPKRLREAADGILSADDQALLRRKASKKLADEQWTAADIALLDEAGHLTAGTPARYGHVVIDEAQDQSAMSLRMLGRRARNGSMTVLGDLAQATAPGALGSWDAALRAIGVGSASAGRTVTATPRIAELTVGYRVPASILDVANRLLVEAAPEVTPARSVRPGGAPPLVIRTDGDGRWAGVVTEVEAVREETASVAVVAIDEHLDHVETALEAADVPVVRVGRSGLPGAEAVALVDADRVKGLEFDAVIVVEPAAIVAASSDDHGLRRLYVSLTRAVRHLGIVHSQDLPPALALDPSSASIDRAAPVDHPDP